MKDGHLLQSTFEEEDGQHLAVLRIPSVRQEDQGEYQCEASNGVANDISAVTALHVHGPPLVQLVLPDGYYFAAVEMGIQHDTRVLRPRRSASLTSSGGKIPSPIYISERPGR